MMMTKERKSSFCLRWEWTHRCVRVRIRRSVIVWFESVTVEWIFILCQLEITGERARHTHTHTHTYRWIWQGSELQRSESTQIKKSDFLLLLVKYHNWALDFSSLFLSSFVGAAVIIQLAQTIHKMQTISLKHSENVHNANKKAVATRVCSLYL